MGYTTDHNKGIPCVLTGMSQGGRIALRFAHQYPEKLWALTLISAPLDGFAPPANKEDTIPIDLYHSLVKSGDIQKMKELWVRHPLMQCYNGPESDLVKGMLKDYEARDLLHWAPTPPSRMPQIASSLDRLQMPALIINGEHDTQWLHLVVRALAYGIADSRHYIISGAGHFCNLSHSTQVNHAMIDFLDSHQPALTR